MELLNEELKDKITIYLNGQIIQKMGVFFNFKIDFISQLTFVFVQKSYSVDDNLVVEQDLGDEIFYIQTGKVALLHRQSYTYIKDLQVIFKYK